MLDFGSWWLMRIDLGFAWGRMVGNGMMSAAFAWMVVASLAEAWLVPPGGNT